MEFLLCFKSSAPSWEWNGDQRQAQPLPHTAAILGTREEVMSSQESRKLSSEKGPPAQNGEDLVTRKEHLRQEKEVTFGCVTSGRVAR